MVTPVITTPRQSSLQKEKRPPLVPSDSGNVAPCRSKIREVSSRYLTTSSSSSSSSNTTSSSNTSASWSSSISSRRCQSPVISARVSLTTPKSSVTKRAISAERRQPRDATTPSNAERMLLTSRRNLSASFQGDSFALVSKVKPLPASFETPESVRNGTPERRKAGVTPVIYRKGRDANTPRIDPHKHRWPARFRGENSGFLTRSLDQGSENKKLNISREEFRKSTPHPNGKNFVDIHTKFVKENLKTGGIIELDRPTKLIDELESDAETVSSPQSSKSGSAIQPRGGLRGLIVPTESRQKANIRGSNSFASIKYPATPSRSLVSSPSTLRREKVGPTRTLSGVDSSVSNSSRSCSTPSMFGFAADRGSKKFGENWISDASKLRLLYNRYLQWRFANSRLENVMLVQKHTAERSFYNAWVSISNLRNRTTSKRIELELLRHNLKLYSILKEQEPHLEVWDMLDRDHMNSLSGSIAALQASIVCLPACGGATVDIQKMKEALASAVNMMRSIDISITCFLAKAEQMNIMASNVSNLTARERGLLREYKELLSATFIPLQVTLCSLRTRALQVPKCTDATSLTSS